MKDQRDNIRRLFQAHPKEWIALPDIMIFAAQYNARLKELRDEGMQIENRIQVINGVRHSWYRYTPKETQMEMVYGSSANVA